MTWWVLGGYMAGWGVVSFVVGWTMARGRFPWERR